MTATEEFIVDTGEFTPNGTEGWASDDALTFVECAAPDCHNIAFSAVPGSGQRSSKYCRQPDCTRTTQAQKRQRADDDPFSSPLTPAERRLAKQLELPLRLAGMGVYRANVVDGLIIGESATPLAEALVLEGRVSKPVKQMCEAVAKFAGAGPIALVLIDMGLQIANNHKVPLLGDVKPVSASIRAQEANILKLRSQRKEQQPTTIADEASGALKGPSKLVACPSCGRNNLRSTTSSTTTCMCGVEIYG